MPPISGLNSRERLCLITVKALKPCTLVRVARTKAPSILDVRN
jgi:hypothetical protein